MLMLTMAMVTMLLLMMMMIMTMMMMMSKPDKLLLPAALWQFETRPSLKSRATSATPGHHHHHYYHHYCLNLSPEPEETSHKVLSLGIRPTSPRSP